MVLRRRHLQYSSTAMPSNNAADDSIQLSFIAVDPFRKRRRRWERRQKPQDVESGVKSSDPQPSNPASGSPAPTSRASTTPASARPPINAGQAPIASRPPVGAHSEPSDVGSGSSTRRRSTVITGVRREILCASPRCITDFLSTYTQGRSTSSTF